MSRRRATTRRSAWRSRRSGFSPTRLGALMSLWIEDYALIGDCETAALVGRMARSMVVLAAFRFRHVSPRCSARRRTDGGASPRADGRESHAPLSRRHDDSRNGLRDGRRAVRVIDFMPPAMKNSDIVRTVVGVRGEVAMQTELVHAFRLRRAVPWVADARPPGAPLPVRTWS